MVAVAPAAKLYVSEYETGQHGAGPTFRFKIVVSGVLQSIRRNLKEVAVFTQYRQEEDPERGIREASWPNVILLVRPHVTDMLSELCDRHRNQHQCELAVCTAAPCLGYAKTILGELDPGAKHLRAAEAKFVGRATSKRLLFVTTMPHTAVIMDDCPTSLPAHLDEGETVWSAEDLKRGLHVPEYIPFVDQDFIRSSSEKVKRVVTLVGLTVIP